MKLPIQINPAHCASNDATRYILQGVRFDKGIAVATDGRVLFVAEATPDDDDVDRPAIVPTRAMLKAFPRNKRKKGSMLPRLVVNEKPDDKFGTVTITDKEFDQTTVREIDGNFPTWEPCVEDPAKAKLRLAINVDLLVKVAKAFGESGLTLHLDPDGFKDEVGYGPAIYVTRSGQEDAFALVMPMRASSGPIAENPLMKRVLVRKAGLAEAETATAPAP